MMQNVISLLDTDGSIDNNPVQSTGTLRALSLVFSQVSPPPELQSKLTALLENANAAALISPMDGTYMIDLHSVLVEALEPKSKTFQFFTVIKAGVKSEQTFF